MSDDRRTQVEVELGPGIDVYRKQSLALTIACGVAGTAELD